MAALINISDVSKIRKISTSFNADRFEAFASIKISSLTYPIQNIRHCLMVRCTTVKSFMD